MSSWCLLGVFNSPKKRTKQFDLTTRWYLNLNCFNHFLGELTTPKRHFEIDWPLAAGRNFRRTGFSTDCRTKSQLCVKYKFSAEPSIPLYSKYFAYLLIEVIVSTPLVKSSFRIKVSRKNSKRSFWGRCGRFLKFYQIKKINAFWEGHKIRKNIPYFFYACAIIPIAEILGDF